MQKIARRQRPTSQLRRSQTAGPSSPEVLIAPGGLPGLRQAELHPIHFAAVAIGALGRYPLQPAWLTPGMAACLHTLPLEYTTNVGCQGKCQVSSAKCQVFFFQCLTANTDKQTDVADAVAADNKARNAARVIFAIST